MTINRDDGWILTFSGLRFWPFKPDPSHILIADIAHALAHQCRFAGHVRQFYSVAEHSVRVSELCAADDALWGLLHDGSEAYLQDIPRPLKRLPELSAYREAELNLQRLIAVRFGLNPEQPPTVTAADDAMLAVEYRQLLQPDHGIPQDATAGIHGSDMLSAPWTPKVAEQRFLERFDKLHR